MLTKCSSVFGHRFEARYDSEPGLSVEAGGRGWARDDVLAVFEATRKLTYIRDVCVRCGQTIERGEKP